MDYAIGALIIWNLTVFSIYGIDKKNAKNKRRRISEKTLIVLAFLMGGVGALSGMYLLRHKTKHLKFKILIPSALLFNIAIVTLLFPYIIK